MKTTNFASMLLLGMVLSPQASVTVAIVIYTPDTIYFAADFQIVHLDGFGFSYGCKIHVTEAACPEKGDSPVATNSNQESIAMRSAFLGRNESAMLSRKVQQQGNSHRNMPFETATEEELDGIHNVHFLGRPRQSSV
jgi:hypothetical protein